MINCPLSSSSAIAHLSQYLKKAEQVVHHYRNQRIILNQVSTKESLNEIFSDLITGKATEEKIIKLVEAT